MMADANEAHARIAANLIAFLLPRLRGNARKQLLGDRWVVFEILSRSTASHDQLVKLAEYRELAKLREIVFVDPQTERVRILARTPQGAWSNSGCTTVPTSSSRRSISSFRRPRSSPPIETLILRRSRTLSGTRRRLP